MNLLDRLIRFSLTHRLLVLSAAGLLLVFGAIWTAAMPVDIFPTCRHPPSPSSPRRGHGARGGRGAGHVPHRVGGQRRDRDPAPALRLRRRHLGRLGRVRLGTDIYQARQVVTERLQRVVLPAQAERPELGPISSIMGEITFIALTGEGVSPMELRRLAETVVRRNLLAIHGVSQVVPIGGDVRQLQVTAHPEALAQHGIGLEEVIAATARASRSPAAGFHVEGGQEYLVRGSAARGIRTRSPPRSCGRREARRSGSATSPPSREVRSRPAARRPTRRSRR